MNEKTPAPVGAAVALDLRSHESLLVAAYALRGASSLTDDDDTAQWLEMLAQQFEDDAANTVMTEDATALVAEVRRLTGVRAECERQFQAQVGLVAAETTRAESAEAEVVTLRARLAAAHEASETIERELICCDTYRMDDSPRPGHQICYWSAAAKAVIDAALAVTTGEGQ